MDNQAGSSCSELRRQQLRLSRPLPTLVPSPFFMECMVSCVLSTESVVY